ncbi:MAG TPA: hypothetical protein VFG04_15560 [Planctomycetaceae bacterium]|jgi:hypothetical protein|nr:hypothetical protein [Planctomycetaceae bacterium]
MKIRGLMISAVVGSLTVGLLTGCMDSFAKQVKKDPNSIINKKTDDIKKFDPNAKQVVSDSKVRVDDPVLYAMQAYGPMMEQISKMNIEHAVDLFHAEHDRYPKDHEEFMTQIIKANQIKLPVLPGGAKYAYDVENHKLQIVKDLEPAKK